MRLTSVSTAAVTVTGLTGPTGPMGAAEEQLKRDEKRQLLGDDACYYTVRHTFSATQRTFRWHCCGALRGILCYND